LKLEPDECAVYCSRCNGYLYATSIFDALAGGQSTITIDCPYKCRPDSAGAEAMTVPPNEQRYGRS
jgi:hypothetical protein